MNQEEQKIKYKKSSRVFLVIGALLTIVGAFGLVVSGRANAIIGIIFLLIGYSQHRFAKKTTKAVGELNK